MATSSLQDNGQNNFRMVTPPTRLDFHQPTTNQLGPPIKKHALRLKRISVAPVLRISSALAHAKESVKRQSIADNHFVFIPPEVNPAIITANASITRQLAFGMTQQSSNNDSLFRHCAVSNSFIMKSVAMVIIVVTIVVLIVFRQREKNIEYQLCLIKTKSVFTAANVTMERIEHLCKSVKPD